MVDITLNNTNFIDFPAMPYVYLGNVGPGSDTFSFETPVMFIGSPPNGTQVTGNFTVYKPLPNPPYFVFACQYPVTFTIRDAVAIDPSAGQEPVHLYPNPAETELRITGANETALFDAQARPVTATCIQFADMSVWQIQNLPAGIYWVRGVDASGRHFSRAFAKVNGQ